ncbi:hypothetical protein B0H17DRAFT_955429, partial [Mycena rosella]
GYILRARYQEGWTASWKGTKKYATLREDAAVHARLIVIDAVHVEDGTFVLLKKIDKTVHTFEVDIANWVSAEPQRSDPENHCVPIREVLQSPQDPKIQSIVMPLLQRYDKPRFDSIGEAVTFFRQIFEVTFMHKHNVAHRDCTRFNIMMDGSPLYSTPIHPVKPKMKRDFSGQASNRSRTQCPVKYYLTDFGISFQYKPEDFRATRYVEPPDCDPFPTDVYYIGNLIRQNFIRGSYLASRKRGFEFMESLVADMVNRDPSACPAMEQVVDRLRRWSGG